MSRFPTALETDAWRDVLAKGLGAITTTVEHAGERAHLSLMRAGPFVVAYPDFPVGAQAYSTGLTAAILEEARARGADVVRFHSRKPLHAPRVIWRCSQGTCVIEDLSAWEETATQKSRRARNREPRSPLVIGPAQDADAERLHELYLATVRRHLGAARYGLAYFRAMAPLTTLVARCEEQVCGFVSFALSGERAFYLHGAHDPAFKGVYPSDQLFLRMLRRAREAGARSFDFLPSPAGQESLVRYKKAWGAESRPFIVSDVAVRPLRARAFEVARNIATRWPSLLRPR